MVGGERGSRCLMFGEQCSRIPHGVFHALFHTSAAAGPAVPAWPRARAAAARTGVVVMRWILQFTLGLLILSGA